MAVEKFKQKKNIVATRFCLYQEESDFFGF